ncbi:HNH endonuclease [Staphylococcus hominis]|uniref:HNH endonuclease n=1 Tax=Staphylococcus hominis TaxID=1290 RepID=UPI001F5A730F|nr:HNH endonuclease [Staphylococcus hominis]MCI2899070.1 HNH endonuclease [Staphylococcus hominis]
MAIFYVYQGETYFDERDGGFLWSPKLNESGHQNSGYNMMTNIKKGDFILHHHEGKLMAISIAQTDYFEAEKPVYQNNKGASWNNDGYRINTYYNEFPTPIKMGDHKKWLASHHKENSAFTRQGMGKQQYMCSIDDEHAFYLLKEAIKFNKNTQVIKYLNNALKDIVDYGEYEEEEKGIIDDLIAKKEESKPKYSNVQKGQEMTETSSKKTKKPKRNPKVAADALALADYKCEYNVSDRTFERKSGKGYTEPHHLIPISKYRDFNYTKCSLDVMQNIVSLCSHCHNLLHYGKFKDKEPILEKLYNERKDLLTSVGLDITLEGLKQYYK